MIYYFDQFPGLEKVILTNREYFYFVQKQDLLNIDCQNLLQVYYHSFYKSRGSLKIKGKISELVVIGLIKN
jgi:hypothetical protein